MFLPVRIEPETYDFKSDTLLSKLTLHLLVSLRLQLPNSHALLSLTKSSKPTDQVVHEQGTAHAWLAQNRECQTWNQQEFFFSHSTASDANIVNFI